MARPPTKKTKSEEPEQHRSGRGPAVRTSKTRAAKEASAENKAESLVRSIFSDSLKEVERKVRLTDSASVVADRVSTGLASLDLILGGGLAPGFHQYSGSEASGKTTCAITLMASMLRDDDIHARVYWDGEGSAGSDPMYLEKVLRTAGANVKANELFGVKDTSGRTIVEPQVYYRDDHEGQKFFDWLAGVQRRMPDKRFIGGKWWYVYDDNQKTKAKLGDTIDVQMTRSANGGLYVPAANGKPQMVIVLDSIPSLVPEAADEDDPSKGIALVARMFSRGMMMTRGAMRSKRVILMGVNQLSINPLQMYGPKESEKGGNTVKHATDTRTRFTARGSGMPYNPNLEGGFQKEASAEYDGRKDTYRYIHIRNLKNKLGMPMRESWLRLWVEDGMGKARGYDPAWDVLQYLTQTGQVRGVRANLKIDIGGEYSAKRGVSIADFKYLILGDKQTKVQMFQDLGMRAIDLRKLCQMQIAKGKSEDLYLNYVYSKPSKGDDDE